MAALDKDYEPTVIISLRLGERLVRRMIRLEDFVSHLQGIRATRSDVMRTALTSGLESLEKEQLKAARDVRAQRNIDASLQIFVGQVPSTELAAPGEEQEAQLTTVRDADIPSPPPAGVSVTDDEIVAYLNVASQTGDTVGVAICEIALGVTVTADLSEHDVYRLEQLNLDGDQQRARDVVASWIRPIAASAAADTPE